MTLNLDNGQEVTNLKTDSIEINKNSKGVTYSVKIYGNSLDDIKPKMEECLAYAKAKENELTGGI